MEIIKKEEGGDNNEEMKALSLKELEMINGDIDQNTKDLLDVIGDIIVWFNNL